MQLLVSRILRRVGCCSAAVILLAGCAQPSVVDDNLAAGGASATEFSTDAPSVTFTALFNADLSARDRFMVEWLFPDGKIYLRKPVGRSDDNYALVETTMPIHGKAPARYPGRWRVRLLRGGDALAGRIFELQSPARGSTSALVAFEGLAFCGPSQWQDAVISGRRSSAAALGVPGAWVGDELLEAAGATYSSAILLTGCAPS